MTPSSLDEAIALADRIAANPAEGIKLADMLADTVDRLPPEAADILSRPFFERASLWTLATSFEGVLADGEAPPQTILCQHDVWIRGVVAVSIPLIGLVSDPSIADLIEQLQLFRDGCATQGANNRGLFETNWRVDARQGFISQGQSEILGPAALVAGDGFWAAPLDWRLQKDQTIEVRVTSRMREFFPQTLGSTFPDNTFRILRWVVVAFWAEELRQPSVR